MDWFQQRAAASLLGSKGAPATPRLRSSCVSSAAGWFDALRRQAAATRQARPWLPCASTCADVAAARCWIVFPGSLRRPVARLVLMLFSAALGSRAPTSWQQRSKTLFLSPLQGLSPASSTCVRAGFFGMLSRRSERSERDRCESPAAPCCIASLEVRVSMLPEARITSSVPTAIEGNALPAIADPRAGHWTVFPTRLAMLLRQRAVHAPGHRSRRALSILLAAREDRLCRYVQASREDRSRSTSKLARRAGLDASSSHQQQCWWHRLSGRCGPCFRKGLRWGPVSVLDGPLELRRAIPYQACGAAKPE